MLSGQTWSVLALIFIWRSYCHQSIHHAGSLLWQRGSSFGQCFIIGPAKLPHKQPNAVNKTIPATPALRAFLDFLAFPLKKKQLFDPHRRALPFLEWAQKKGRSLPHCFHAVHVTFPNMSFKYNQVASRGILYTGFVNSPFAHSLNLNPPILFLCVCRPPSTTHLLSFTPLRPISLCAGAWTVCVACNTNYCALLGSREQRGEITEVWSTNLQRSASASLSLRRNMSPGAVWVQVLVHYRCLLLAPGCIYGHVMHQPRQED